MRTLLPRTTLPDRTHKVILPTPTRLNIPRAHLQHLLEIHPDVCQLPLQQHDDVLVVLVLLARAGGLRARELLQSSDLLVQTREILLDHVGELGDLDGAVVEEGFSFCQFAESLQFRHCGADAAADLCGVAREFAALFACWAGGGAILLLLGGKEGLGVRFLVGCDGFALAGEGFLGLGEDAVEFGGAVLDCRCVGHGEHERERVRGALAGRFVVCVWRVSSWMMWSPPAFHVSSPFVCPGLCRDAPAIFLSHASLSKSVALASKSSRKVLRCRLTLHEFLRSGLGLITPTCSVY